MVSNVRLENVAVCGSLPEISVLGFTEKIQLFPLDHQEQESI